MIEIIAGTIRLSNGVDVQFKVDSEGYFQWGANQVALGETVEVMEALEDAIRYTNNDPEG